MAVLFLELG